MIDGTTLSTSPLVYGALSTVSSRVSLFTKTFNLRLLLCVAFAGPVGYVGYISAVAVHEVLGHGAAAWVLGGTFGGFALMPDGMGSATAEAEGHQNLVLAAGVLAGTGFGIALLLLARWVTHPLAKMVCLLFAFSSLEDATPYAFWNSAFPRPPGDFGRILLDLQSAELRWSLVVGSGVAYVASTIGCNIAIFRCFESLLGRLTRIQAIMLAWVFFGFVGGVAWFGFDWNLLIQDVGRVPQYVGASLQFAIAPLLVATRKRELVAVSVSNRCWAGSIASAWLVAGSLVVVLQSWLRHGVSWTGE